MRQNTSLMAISKQLHAVWTVARFSPNAEAAQMKARLMQQKVHTQKPQEKKHDTIQIGDENVPKAVACS